MDIKADYKLILAKTASMISHNFLDLSFAGLLKPSSAASWLSSLPRRPFPDRDLRNLDILRFDMAGKL